MTTPVQLGWQTAHKDYSIKQGAQGSIQLRLQVANDDGTPLLTYTGFTAKFTLHTSAGLLVQEFTEANNGLAVASDAINELVIVTLIFTPAHTLMYPAGQKLVGDLKLTLPNGTEHQYPYEMTLLVLRSFTP